MSNWPAHAFRPLLVFVMVAAVAASFGCGDAGPPNVVSNQTQQAPVVEESAGTAVRPDGMYTVDALVDAGWKRSKQLDASLLPGATEVWYGFYDRRDIEVRVYPTHADATGPGVVAALEAIGRSPNSNIGGGIITSLGNRTQYHAYVVAGNLVLLCEQSTETCLQLVDRLQ